MTNQVLLLADSGSTKTDWLLLADRQALEFQTPGLNPFLMKENEIRALLTAHLVPQLCGKVPACIRFWGAGCRDAGTVAMRQALLSLFPTAEVVVESDLTGAARALFGRQSGIACILGTGSNSGVYDGEQITANTPPLGYLLGDEGSGASLGKRFLNLLLKGALPLSLARDFYHQYALTAGQVLHDVYHSPTPNRFLARFAPFLHAHRQEEVIHELILNEFLAFFKKNVCPYGRTDLKVGFVGSIAYYFSDELRQAALESGFQMGAILRRPLKAFLDNPDLLPGR